MQVFQTAGDPPSKGKRIFPNRGCSTNMSDALTNNVPANNKVQDKLWLVFAGCDIFEFINRVLR